MGARGQLFRGILGAEVIAGRRGSQVLNSILGLLEDLLLKAPDLPFVGILMLQMTQYGITTT